MAGTQLHMPWNANDICYLTFMNNQVCIGVTEQNNESYRQTSFLVWLRVVLFTTALNVHCSLQEGTIALTTANVQFKEIASIYIYCYTEVPTMNIMFIMTLYKYISIIY